MAGYLQFEAPTALEYFAALVADDASFSVLEAAVAVAQDDAPGLDVQGVLAEVDALADRLRRRLPADAAPLQRLRLLNQYFFRELGFAGNVNDYYDRRNSSVPAVLRSRRGIPITLALLYIEMAAAVELPASGVSFPGHFLVKLHMPRGEVVIDPFSGRSLTREDLEERLLPYRREHGLTGDDAVPLGLFLQAASGREVIARLLRNLKEVHRSARDWPRIVATLQRLVVLLPQDWEERRDHALALFQLGRLELAASELALYLEHRPQAADAAALRLELAAWRRRH
ncbi:MAG: transglutaminase-like domain-containing protein [Rubrivivax sp.]|nr:transglutaminase-like domain-containing protein [Rubrivivax sp.]